MLTFQQIKISDTAWYNYTEGLMVASFPPEEYRELNSQRTLTDEDNQFALHILLEDGNPAGFIAWWNFTSFLYIEHFAIDPAKRNRGLGRTVLQKVKESIKLPIVLETEPPLNEINQRRISFYQRNGFHLCKVDYLQPPYRKGNPPINLCLMATRELNTIEQIEKVISILYHTVYKVF